MQTVKERQGIGQTIKFRDKKQQCIPKSIMWVYKKKQKKDRQYLIEVANRLIKPIITVETNQFFTSRH